MADCCLCHWIGSLCDLGDTCCFKVVPKSGHACRAAIHQYEVSEGSGWNQQLTEMGSIFESAGALFIVNLCLWYSIFNSHYGWS